MFLNPYLSVGYECLLPCDFDPCDNSTCIDLTQNGTVWNEESWADYLWDEHELEDNKTSEGYECIDNDQFLAQI